MMVAPKCDSISGVAQLSTQLVQQWLMIVKGTAGQIQQQVQAQNQIQAQTQPQSESSLHQTDDNKPEDIKPVVTNDAINTENDKEEQKIEETNEGISTGTFYKAAGKDGKQSTRKSSVESKSENDYASDDTDKSEDRKDVKDKEKSKTKTSKSNKHRSKERDDRKSERDSEKDKKKSSSSSKSSSKYKSTSSSKSRDDKDKDRHRDKGKEKERDKNRERDKSKDADKDKHRSNGGLKHLSTPKKSSKDHRDKSKEKSKHDEKDKEKLTEKEKEKQIEKDNNTLEKLKPPTIDKLGRIPKKTSVVDDKSKENSLEARKKAFSVGIRKDKESEDRPKTVKVFNSKMRSTGLEEEVKLAPPRSGTTNKKPIPSVQLPTIPQKRPSPPKDIREPFIPPEKKLKMDKIDVPERPGAIKLIPPKPKRKFAKTLYSFLFYFYRYHRKEGGSIQRPYNTLQGPVSLTFADNLPTLECDRVPWFHLLFLAFKLFFLLQFITAHVQKYTRFLTAERHSRDFIDRVYFSTFQYCHLVSFVNCANL